MKANAQEKIYLHLTTGNHLLNGKYYEYKPAKIRFDDKIIEYIRTDAFVEKVCEWLSKHAKKYYFNKDGHYLGTDELIEDFKLSMEL